MHKKNCPTLPSINLIVRPLAEAEFQKEKAKNDAKNKTTEKLSVDKVKQITQFVLPLSGAEILQQLYLVAVTAGYSSSVVELTPVAKEE